MSRRASRRRQSRTRFTGGLLPRLLSLPARRNVRWPFIAAVMIVTAGLYLHVLLTSPPMPPGTAPVPPSGGTGQAQHAQGL